MRAHGHAIKRIGRLAGILAVVCLTASFGDLRGAGKLKKGEWPEITEAERTLETVGYAPDATAVLLNNERHGRIVDQSGDWVNIIDYHWRLKILKPEGAEQAEVRIGTSKYSRVSNLSARTISPDGTITPVDESQIHKDVRFQMGSTKILDLVFHFPAVEPGAILEYKYDRFDDFLMNIDPFYFEGSVPTLHAKVSQIIPATMGYQFLCARCPAGSQPTVSKRGSGKLYEIELSDLEGYRNEIFMPPRRDVSPRVEMTLYNWKGMHITPLDRSDDVFIDWASVSRFAHNYYESAAKEGSRALQELVAGWIDGLESEEDKIRVAFEHVRDDFGYIPYVQVVGGSRSIERILEDRTADNEEKAVLLQAALASAGIRSKIALVVGRHIGEFNPEFHSLSQFTHAIVGIPQAEGRMMWLDPTESYASFDFVSWKNSGAPAILVDKKKGELIELPSKNEASKEKYDVTIHPKPDGSSTVAVSAEFSGQDAVDFREYLLSRGAEARENALRRWAKRIQPDAEMTSHEIENLDSMDKNLIIKFEAEMGGLVTLADDIMLVKGCVFTGYDSNPISTTRRKFPLYVNKGWNINETVTIRPPDGMKAAEMPSIVKANSGVARLTFNCTSSLDGSVRCTRVFIARRQHHDVSKIAALRNMFDRVVEADRTAIAFQPEQQVAEGSE